MSKTAKKASRKYQTRESPDFLVWYFCTSPLPITFAPAHCFFPCLKSHEAVWTTRWRTMASFCNTIFSSRVRMRTDHLAMKLLLHNIAELEIQLVCKECLKRDWSGQRYIGWSCVLNCLSYHPYLVSMLFADLLSLHLLTVLMFLFILVMTCA